MLLWEGSLMAFINIKPELKQNMERLSDILNIPEPLLISANANASADELYFPGVSFHAGKTFKQQKHMNSCNYWRINTRLKMNSG